MRGQPAGPGRVAAEQVKDKKTAHPAPPGGLHQVFSLDLLAAVPHQVVQPRAQMLVEHAVLDDDVGFQVQRQAERVQVAGADRGPFVVGQRHLAVQRPLAVFKNMHAGRQQVVVEHAGGGLDDRHVRLALQDEAHVNAAPGRLAQFLEQPVARKKVGVGNHHAVARRADGDAVVALDVGGVLAVVAGDEDGGGVTGGRGRLAPALRQREGALGQALAQMAGIALGRIALSRCQRLEHKRVNHGHDGACNLHRVVLFGRGAVVGQVVG